MRAFKGVLLACAMVVTATAQSQEPPIGDTRLTVHTLLREDVFAGFLDNNMERFARADRNLDALLKQRPDQRANLLAWKAGMNALSRRAGARSREGRRVREVLRGGERRLRRGRQTLHRQRRRRGDHRRHLRRLRRPSAAGAPRRGVGAGLRVVFGAVESSRARRSTSCPCTSRARCSPAWRSRRSAPAAPRSPPSSSIGC